MIIQMGNNGPLYGEDMEALRKATAEVGELFLINDHAPVSWIDESNHALAEAARDWPHTTLIDWAPIAAAHEDLLWDGIHLTPAAAGLYARLVTQRCTKRSPSRRRPSRSGTASRAQTPGSREPSGGRRQPWRLEVGSGTRTTTSSTLAMTPVGALDRADRDGRGARR